MTPLRRLLSYFAKYRRALTLGGLCVVGSAAFSLLKPMIVGNAVDVLTHGVTRSAMIRSALMFFGAFAMMMRIDREMALISLIAVPVVAGLVSYFGQRIHLKFKSVQDYFGDISARVQENLSGVRVVRAFTQEPNEIANFKRMNRE